MALACRAEGAKDLDGGREEALEQGRSAPSPAKQSGDALLSCMEQARKTLVGFVGWEAERSFPSWMRPTEESSRRVEAESSGRVADMQTLRNGALMRKRREAREERDDAEKEGVTAWIDLVGCCLVGAPEWLL